MEIKEELFEIIDYVSERTYRKNGINDELKNKILKTFEKLMPNQAFVVPKNMCCYSNVRKILNDYHGTFTIQPVGSKRFSKEHTGTRIVKIKKYENI